MKVIIGFLGILISSLTFGQSENELFESFKASFQSNSKLNTKYQVSKYIEPQYLTSDFNGDSIKDLAILIIDKNSKKQGFVIYHPNTNDFFVIGAGHIFNEEDKWDDLNWVDFWQINTIKSNRPGIQGDPILLLEMDSIEITKDEVGGGIIYWDGTKYNYFHQTC